MASEMELVSVSSALLPTTDTKELVLAVSGTETVEILWEGNGPEEAPDMDDLVLLFFGCCIVFCCILISLTFRIR